MAWDYDEEDNRSRALGYLMFATLAAGCAVGGYYYWRRQQTPSSYATTGFDLNQVEAQPEAPVTYTPPPKQQPASSPLPIVGSGFSVSFGGSRPAAGPKFVKNGPSEDELKREQQFLARYGGVLRAYAGRLDRITVRHYKNSPVVREVDHAFGGMPRYMAVHARFEKDRNPFAFARDSLALPEVRAEIGKRMADPRVWKEAVTMVLEALRDPPPDVLYKEAQRFMTKDATMVDYLPEFTGQVTRNVGTAMQGIPKDADLAPLQKVMHDIAPTAAPALPNQR